MESILRNVFYLKYQPSGGGALAHCLQRRTTYKIQNGRQWAPKLWMGSGRSKQLSLNKFFDLSTPSMRKEDNGEKMGGRNLGKTK